MPPHILSNVVYLKNISPLLSDVQLREFLNPALKQSGAANDEIVRIEFKQFPGSTQRYCQVDFKSSSGVTAATSLNGQTLLGVPIVITVIDPSTNIAQGMLPGIMPGMFGTAGGLPSLLPTNIFNGAQGDIQLAAMQAAALALQQARPPPTTVTSSVALPMNLFNLYGQPLQSRETESQVIARTIQVDNLPESIQDVHQVSDHVCSVARQLGYGEINVTEQKLIHVSHSRIALLELKTVDMAEKLKRLPEQYLTINKIPLKLSTAKSTVTPRDPDNVSFEPPPSAPVPVAYQQLTKLKLAGKIARARALAEKLSNSSSGNSTITTTTTTTTTPKDLTPLPTNTGSQVPSDLRARPSPIKRHFGSTSPRDRDLRTSIKPRSRSPPSRRHRTVFGKRDDYDHYPRGRSRERRIMERDRCDDDRGRRRESRSRSVHRRRSLPRRRDEGRQDRDKGRPDRDEGRQDRDKGRADRDESRQDRDKGRPDRDEGRQVGESLDCSRKLSVDEEKHHRKRSKRDSRSRSVNMSRDHLKENRSKKDDENEERKPMHADRIRHCVSSDQTKSEGKVNDFEDEDMEMNEDDVKMKELKEQLRRTLKKPSLSLTAKSSET